MRCIIIYFFIFLGGATLSAQEICDNGVDDDGDGLTDLYDDECVCTGVTQTTDQTNKIPNPDFENYSICPTSWSQIEYCTGWERGTFGTSDYLNTCGYVTPGVLSAGLVPFPSGDGCTGAYFTESWKEYVATCLTTPLSPGLDYELTFYIAACSVLDGFIGCSPFSYAPVNVTLWGGPDCTLPVPSTGGCPSDGDPDWVPLGTVTYSPVSEWAEVSISFTAPSTIAAIMLGPPCVVPPGYGGPDCYPFIVYDDLHLFGDEVVQDLTLVDIGAACDAGYTLSADIDFPDPGTWQWYWNGVALTGQTGQELLLSGNNYQSGIYQVVFTSGNGCAMDSLSVNIPDKDTTMVELSFCPDSEIECAGEIFSIEGVYEVILPGYNGCDSVVTCVLEAYELPPVTYLAATSCAPFDMEVCGTILQQSGHYEIVCPDARGCDSLVVIDIQILAPEVVVLTPDTLGCDSSKVVILDGSLSSVNDVPGGQTTYSWSGPAGGIQGNTDEPWVSVSLPGEYCLVVTHESEGVSCADTGCVTVQRSIEFPAPPLLTSVAGGCLGDTVTVSLSGQGNALVTSFQWFIDPGISHMMVNDSVLLYFLTGLDTVRFCAIAENSCGVSDSSCIQVITSLGDTTMTINQTCDPAMVGVDTVMYENRFGCDSIVMIQTLLWPSSVMEVMAASCDPSLVGMDTVIYQNQFGCDSLVITTTSLLPSHTINQTIYTCDPAQAGLDTVYLTNQYGCDSTLYIERIYSGNYQETNQILICGSGMNYADTLLIATGPCDSLFITNYMYAPLDTTWLSGTTCDPLQAGISVTIQPSALGCDSTIITTNSLSPTDSTLVSGVTCDPGGAMYNVIVLSNQYGCDSVVTTVIEYVGIDTLYVEKTTCEPSQVGTIVSVLPGVDCDTVLVTETTYVPFTQSEETIILCGQTGVLSDTIYLQNAAGCDSLAIRYYEYISLSSQYQIQGETCAGDQDGSIELTAVVGGVAPYEGKLNGGNWQSATLFDNLPPGQYTLVIRDAAGCLDTLSGLVVAPGAIITIDAGPDRTAAPGEVIDLSAQTTQSLAQVQWTATDPLLCPGCLQTTLGPLTTNQTVIVTGWTQEGCSDTDALEVIIKTRGNIFIPNSFTPNNDGINDVFSIFGNDQVLSIRNLAIFDRWGNALYSRSDLPINDPSAGWDGTFRDEVMDPGVYIYVVEVELVNGEVQLYKGDVTVVR
ncbi:MAG: gliding motility-associated C-terminal domain-containing protein [Lewinellaceae bacterium]|nr:gliding motility-associated C-terminal domain-containing protein [Lewinellaceae bacterium]